MLRDWLTKNLLIGGITVISSVATTADETFSQDRIDVKGAISSIVDKHPGKSGLYVLDKGEEALRARAWLTDHAAETIDVQYFIWSTDNIGVLASEALLRAADRGVHVRVLVDDLLVDASNQSLTALSAHPRIQIRIYNPKHSVGTSKLKKFINVFTDFRGVNLRMHNKTFVVDHVVGITGGRNMADEYFDYAHKYNFRDRDILLFGPVVRDMARSFSMFWESEWAVPVEELLARERSRLSQDEIASIYEDLHQYAQNPENYPQEVREALNDISRRFFSLFDTVIWDEIEFISDVPGKNPGTKGLLGEGGITTKRLVAELRKSQKRVTIQSPYLVMPDGGVELFRELIQRGVDVRISTNSLQSTDNMAAFSGYRKQRSKLLKAGINIYEFKPDPAIQKDLIERYEAIEESAPIFAIHAKTLVVDGQTLYIGSFNLDPRSANLNTEVGVLIRNAGIARQVERSIEIDMRPENSWNARTDSPDSHSPVTKRLRLQFWKLLPLKELL